MALPRVVVEVGADTVEALGGLDAVENKLEQLADEARRTGQHTDKLNSRLRNVGRGSSAFGRGIQNASFQLGDFATQVGAGTSASIALGQQLPQLLGGFGILGAVLGAVVAVAVPLTRVMGELSKQGKDLTSVFGTMQPVAEGVATAFSKIGDMVMSFAEVTINNLDRVISTALVAATVFGGKFVAGFVAARVATMSLAGAMTFLRGALIRTGIGALIVGAGELVYQFSKLAQGVGGVGNAFAMVGAVFVEVWDRIKRGAVLVQELFEGLGLVIEGALSMGFARAQEAFHTFLNVVQSGLNQLGANWPEFLGGPFSVGDDVSNPGTDNVNSAQSLIDSGAGIMSSSVSQMGDMLGTPLESITSIRDVLRSIRDENLDLASLLSGEGADGSGKGAKGKSAWDEMIENMQRVRSEQDMLLNSSSGMWGEMGTLIQQFAGKSKVAAIAAIAIQKGLSISQIIANTAAAQMRALAELGPIAGPPVAAKIGLMGKVQAGLVAATGLVQAAHASQSGGSSVGSVASSVSSSGSSSSGASGDDGSSVQRQRSLTLIGERFNRAQAVEIAEFMNDGTDDGLVIRGRR